MHRTPAPAHGRSRRRTAAAIGTTVSVLAVLLAIAGHARSSATLPPARPSAPPGPARVAGYGARPADAASVPTPAAGPSATLVPPGATAALTLASDGATLRLDTGAHLAFDLGAAYRVDQLLYDPIVLQPGAPAGDGSPVLDVVDLGATYLSAVATPLCLGAPSCTLTPVPIRVTVVTGGLTGDGEAAALDSARPRATALAQPTVPHEQVVARATAEARLAAEFPPTPEPTVDCLGGWCTKGHTGTPAGDGIIVSPAYQPGGGIFATNAWYEQTPSRLVSVYAGALLNRTTGKLGAGSVQVVITSDSSFLLDTAYLAPGQPGQLHIVSATGERLTLASTDGGTFVFDVPSLQFLPPGSPAPGTPPPAGTAPAGGTATATLPATAAAASPSPLATGAAPDLANPTVQAAIAGGQPPPLLVATPDPTPVATAAALATAAP